MDHRAACIGWDRLNFSLNRTGVVELRFFTIHLGPKSADGVDRQTKMTSNSDTSPVASV